jgi:hypothetical protein
MWIIFPFLSFSKTDWMEIENWLDSPPGPVPNVTFGVEVFVLVVITVIGMVAIQSIKNKLH